MRKIKRENEMNQQKKIGLVFTLGPVWGTIITSAILIFGLTSQDEIQISTLMTQMFYANIPFLLGFVLCPVGIFMLFKYRRNQQSLEQQTN